jgi:hypothetical protein
MIGMMFNYSSIALTAIGRPYLAAGPVIVFLLTQATFGFLFFDGHIERYSWVICAASIASAPVMIMQNRVYLHHRFSTLLIALWPSALVTIICITSAWFLKMMLPSSLPAMATLLILAIPLATIWYLALRITSHPLANELHDLASGLRTRYA